MRDFLTGTIRLHIGVEATSVTSYGSVCNILYIQALGSVLRLALAFTCC